MILSRRKHRRRRQTGGSGTESMSLINQIKQSQTTPPVSKPSATVTPPPVVSSSFAIDQQRLEELQRYRHGRLPGDEKLSDIQSREQKPSSSLVQTVTKPIRDATVSKSIGSLREAAKDPSFRRAALSSIVQPVSTVSTVGEVGTSLAVPELIPAMTYSGSTARKESVGDSIKETAKTIPFALAGEAGTIGNVAKTAAVAEIANQTAEDINNQKSDAEIATNLALGVGSILPEGEAAGKSFSKLTKGQKAIRATRDVSKIGKDVLEIKDALKPVETESVEETAAERTSKILDANKNHTFTSTQLDNIQTHIDRHGYNPSKKLKEQLDTRKKDRAIEQVLKENPNVDLNETQVKNVNEFLKRNPQVDLSYHIGRQLDEYDKKFGVVSFQDVDSTVRTGFMPRQIRRVTPNLKTKEIDCSLLKGKKDREKCEFNKKALKKKRIKK